MEQMNRRFRYSTTKTTYFHQITLPNGEKVYQVQSLICSLPQRAKSTRNEQKWGFCTAKAKPNRENPPRKMNVKNFSKYNCLFRFSKYLN